MSKDPHFLVNAPGPSIGNVPDAAGVEWREIFEFASREANDPTTKQRGYRLTLALAPMLLMRERGDDFSANRVVHHRMELFRRGEWDSLLEYASQEGREAMAPRRGPQEVEEGRAERETISLVMQGELSRAIQKLESGAMAIPGPEVWDELVRLHPEPTPGFERPPDPGVPAMTLNRDIFEQFVQELPRARAPGTTQLRHMHLQSVIQHGGKDALYDLCNDILRGGVPADLQPFFAGARLFALEKAQGGIRPIACGEVLRRLVASMAAKQMRAGLLEYLAPGPEEGVQQPAQLGVGARGGSDVMVRGIQAALDAHPDQGWHLYI